MHLREVHLENFKSFHHKLVIPFEPGFTGVCGPNGAGKSNVGDAILFVLGPNSPRVLRAGNLGDLIFKGIEGGHGAPKLPPADSTTVSLVFDNADRLLPVEADTVTLTRKARRTPADDNPNATTSYFWVNGRASQKKEFVDILQHARISADGYNITKQGDVNRIIEMSGMDRRRILEDMAGITAYDNDIARADKDKEAVVAELGRIQIVLDEIAKLLDQLEKDKGAATRYRDLQNQVAELKALMAWRRKGDLEGQLAGLKEQIERAQKSATDAQKAIDELDLKKKAARTKFEEAEAELARKGGAEMQELRQKLQDVQKRLTQAEERIKFAESQMQDAREKGGPLQKELRGAEGELAAAKKTQTTAAARRERAEAERAEKTKEMEAAQNLLSKSDKGAMELNRELSTLKQEHEAKQTELHAAKLEADRLAERTKALDHAQATLEAELSATDRDLEEARFNLKTEKETGKGAGAKAKEMAAKLLELRKQQAELAKQDEELEGRIRRLQRELAELQARENAAEQLRGGMGRAVEAVLECRKKGLISGIIGTVTELAQVEDKYRTAVQVAAAGRLNAILVKDDDVAQKVKDYLSQNRIGVVTLLPLNKVVPGRPRAQALQLIQRKAPGCFGLVTDFIKFNGQYRDAFFQVFGDTVLADNLQNARKMMGGVRLVTLEGDLLEAGGAMTVGHRGKSKENEVTFGGADRGRVDELILQIQQSEEAQTDCRTRLATAKEALDAINRDLAAQGVAGAGTEERLKELTRKVEDLEAKLKDLKQKRKDAENEIAGTAKLAEKNETAIAAATVRLAELETLRETKGTLLLKSTPKQMREKMEKLQAAATELQTVALEAAKEEEVAAAHIMLLEKRIAELESQGAVGEAATGKAQQQMKADNEIQKKARIELEALMRQESKLSGAHADIQARRDKAYKETVDLDGRIKSLMDKRETSYGLVQRYQAGLPAIEAELAEAVAELAARPIDDAKAADAPSYDEMKKELRSAEAAMERIGTVNLRALDEFEAQTKRADEMKLDAGRLTAQKAHLEAVVADISIKKKAALLEVFEEVRKNFTEIYAQLQPDGRGEIKLETPDKPFDGGLLLRAAPSGKAMLRIEGLSGGEKGLCAMAFIFALQRYDPSPFYYLDEVDQSLDAENAQRLARMIRAQSKFAQFLMVSHKKVALAECNHVYGVFQKMPGLSDIISRFDIDTLPDDSGEGAEVPRGPPPGGDGNAGKRNGESKPAKKKPAKEQGLNETVTKMMAVEVKA